MIKQPWLLVVSAVCLTVALWLVADRVMFLMKAEETVGTVADVTASNGRCGSRRSKHNCTRYGARVEYETGAGVHSLSISAGSARGHSQPLSRARVQKNGRVPVVYSPDTPERSYENTVFGVWGAPLMAFFAQIATFIGSLTKGRARRSG